MKLETKQKYTFIKGIILGIFLPIIILLGIILPILLIILLIKHTAWLFVFVIIGGIFFGEMLLIVLFYSLLEWGLK